MRRSAVSIPANIAEGFKKRTNPDKIRLLNIAEGSLEELRYYFILAVDLGYLESETSHELLEETSKLLCRYVQAIEQQT